MTEFENKLARAKKKHAARLGLPPETSQRKEPPVERVQTAPSFAQVEEELAERMTSVSQTWSTASRMSKGPALIHKIKHSQSKVKAKAEAINRVIFHDDIKSNPKTLARAGVVWSQIETDRDGGSTGKR